MNGAELPTMSASSYASSVLPPAHFAAKSDQARERRMSYLDGLVDKPKLTPTEPEQPSMATPTMRFVKIYIADINENLPLDKRMLYTGDDTFTDLTDQELFFDVPIVSLLAAHNDLRKATIDKAQSDKFGRDVFLEPVRIRDLKMVVVTLAAF